VLGVDAEQAEIDACKIEHLLSVESSVKLASFIKCLKEESDTAAAFRKVLRKSHSACSHDVSHCPVCQTVCFYEVKSKEKAKSGAGKSERRARGKVQ